MKRIFSQPLRLLCLLAVTCALLSCGITALAAEPLYPANVQTIIEDSGRQIVKTYVLTAEDKPDNIPQSGFVRDSWWYALADITQTRTSEIISRNHTEMVEISIAGNDISEIIEQLDAALEFQSEDGFCGLLTLDIASIRCEAAGYKNKSYTVSAAREYPHLSENDLSLIPKSITDGGKTLELDDVVWEVQQTINVDYDEIPESYRAIATYTAKASKRVVTGYITTAEYSGELAKTVPGDTIYSVFFQGTEIVPVQPEPTPEPTVETPPMKPDAWDKPLLLILIGVATVAALLGGTIAYLLLHHKSKRNDYHDINEGI